MSAVGPRPGSGPGSGHPFDSKDSVPLAVGGVFGLRAFTVREWRLSGPAWPFIYVPGVNQAECRTYGPDHPDQDEVYTYRSYFWSSDHVEFQRMYGHQHRIAGRHCQCGFYAFWDGSNDYYSRNYNSISAVIYGYGTVTYGDRGFRCSKLEIKAAVNPWLITSASGETDRLRAMAYQESDEPRNWWERYQRLAYVFKPFTVFSLWTIGVLLVLSNVIGIAGLGWLYYVGVAMVNVGTLNSFLGSDWQRKVRIRENTRRAAELRLEILNEYRPLDPKIFELIAKRYPDIKWYATHEEMLADFPLTKYEDLPHHQELSSNHTKEKNA